jgi:hypothetical protein
MLMLRSLSFSWPSFQGSKKPAEFPDLMSIFKAEVKGSRKRKK